MKTLLIGLLSGYCCLWIAMASHAAPVTFRFEAVVNEVNQDPNPLVLPFAIALGDTITGTFTFEPLDVPSTAKKSEITQNFPMLFKVNSYSFSASSYLAISSDDILSDEDNGGPGIPDPPAPSDEIRLSRTLGDSLGDPQMTEWSFAIALFGDSTVLDGADFPAEVSTWQKFSEGSLRLTFINPLSMRSLIIRAALSPLQEIPEPGSSGIIVACLLACIFRRVRLASRG
jgi:hypothetical protein